MKEVCKRGWCRVDCRPWWPRILLCRNKQKNRAPNTIHLRPLCKVRSLSRPRKTRKICKPSQFRFLTGPWFGWGAKNKERSGHTMRTESKRPLELHTASFLDLYSLANRWLETDQPTQMGGRTETSQLLWTSLVLWYLQVDLALGPSHDLRRNKYF